MPGFYLGEDPIEPSSLGVAPLQNLYAGGTRDRPEPTTPLVTEDTRKREMLARILLGLSTFGGYKAPSFLSEELRLRGQERVATAKEGRKVERLRASANLIGQAREAEARGDDAQASEFYRQALGTAEDPQMAKEITTALGQASGRRRVGGAAADVNRFVVEKGVEALDHSARLAVRTRLLQSGMPEPHVEAYMKGLETTWTQSKDGRTLIGTRNDGKEPWQIPLETVEKLGGALIRLRGTQVQSQPGDVRPGVIAETPEPMAVSPGQEIIEKPGLRVPGVQGAAPVPSPGAIQPVGGEQLGAPEAPGTLRTLRPATPVETPLTAEHRLALTGSKYATVRTFEELDRQGGGGALRQAIEATGDKQQKALLDRQDALMRARVAEMGFEWDRKEKERREQAREEKETTPLNERSRYWFNTQTYTRAPDEMSAREAKAAGYRSLGPTDVRSLEAIMGIKTQLEQGQAMVLAHPEWFFPRTGSAVVDKALERKAGFSRWANSSHPDSGVLAALAGRVAQFARAAGDTRISNLDTQLQAYATGFDIPWPGGASISREAAFGRFISITQTLNSQLRVMGFGQLVVPGVPGAGPTSVPGIKLEGGRQSEDRAFGRRGR